MAQEEVHELRNIKVNKIGVVDRGAVQREFLVRKRDGDGVSTPGKVAKAEDTPLMEQLTAERLGMMIGKLEELKAGIGTMTADEVRENFRAIGNGLWSTEDDMVAMAKSFGIDLTATIEPDEGATPTTKRDPMSTGTETPSAVELLKRDDLSDEVRAVLQKSVDDATAAEAATTAAAEEAAEAARVAKAANETELEKLRKSHDDEVALRKKRDAVEVVRKEYGKTGNVDEVAGLLMDAEDNLSDESVKTLKSVLKRFDALAKSSPIFKETGTGNGEAVAETAYEEICAIADELFKAGTFDTVAKARTHVMTTNTELRKRHNAEKRNVAEA